MGESGLWRSASRRALGIVLLLGGLLTAAVVWKTASDLSALPASLGPDPSRVRKVQLLDRDGIPLTVTYQNRWNVNEHVPLHAVPRLLQQAFIQAEDRRFYQHGGVDWLARIHAALQNLRAGRGVRGASTITEQVVRMLHPRPRTLWSRWVEGIEAGRLEARFSKAAILEFYLDQVPYAGQRRGIVQAARYYFDRDLDTLTLKEMLALAVLVRAPTRMDLRVARERIRGPIARLASRMRELEIITDEEYRGALRERLALESAAPPLQAAHFVEHVYRSGTLDLLPEGSRVLTTLDGSLQQVAQRLLDRRLEDLRGSDVNDGAILVVDHRDGQILAWVNGGDPSDERTGSSIDAVTVPRQPGSTLKPFVYALALEKGWTAATLIDDSPLAIPVGTGLHAYRNYSRLHWGLLRLRDALGNSLNIPAVRAVQFTGASRFYQRLRSLGFDSLTRGPDDYGDGLALGNAEVSLLELVQAYATLARGGEFRPLGATLGTSLGQPSATRVFSEEVSSIIADILSDPQARTLEFGHGNLLRFPVQTAVKTGTSSGYRDAWAVGFSRRYTVGVWMGNLDRRPMRTVTGSSGPALVLRAVYAELYKDREAEPLSLSPRLARARICAISGELAGPHCPAIQEWFERGTLPRRVCPLHAPGTDRPPLPGGAPMARADPVRLLQPTPGLQLALDPRIPDELEAFPLALPRELHTGRVDWIVDGEIAGSTAHTHNEFLWTLSRGKHWVQARVWFEDGAGPRETERVNFLVK
jgi:penicillin-binding protein 1C